MSDHVDRLLAACPFLRPHLDPDFIDLATVVFGSAGRAVMEGRLSTLEQDAVFDYFNALAEHGTLEELNILGTGAIEIFNDDERSQRLAREKLTGAALLILEKFRLSWGQPDYGRAS